MTSSPVRSRVRELAEQAITACPAETCRPSVVIEAIEATIAQALREALGEPSEGLLDAVSDADWKRLNQADPLSYADTWRVMARHRLSEMGVEPSTDRGGV